MSNTQKHEAAYQAFAEGDFDAAFKDISDDVVIHGMATGLPTGGDFKGKEAMLKEWLPAVGETFQGLKQDVARYIEDGDWVVAVGHQTSEVNGTSVSADFAHVWRWENGEIVEVWFYGDSAQAVAALG